MRWRLGISPRDAFLCATAGVIVFVGIRLAFGLVLDGELAFWATMSLFALAAVVNLLLVKRRGAR